MSPSPSPAALAATAPEWLSYVPTISALVAVASFVVALFYGLSQVRQNARTRELQALQKIFDDMLSEQRRERRARVLLNAKPYDEWTPEERRDADREIEKFQQMGFFVRHKLLRPELIFQMYSLLTIRMWERLEGRVNFLRSNMKAENFGTDFQKLASRSKKYRLAKGWAIDGPAVIEMPTNLTMTTEADG